MKNSDVKYQALLSEEGKEGLDDEDLALPMPAKLSPKSPSSSSNRFCCSSKLAFVLVIAIFVILYLVTTLEVSFVDNRQTWKVSHNKYAGPPASNGMEKAASNSDDDALQKRILKPLSNLLNQLSSSVKKLGQGRLGEAQNLSAILPPRVQLNDSMTYRRVEAESNLAATYWERWSRPGYGRKAAPKAGVKYCHDVQMISPHLVKQNNIFWQVVDASAGRNTDKEPAMKLYLYNAYYDDRLWGKPKVKLITTTDHQIPVETRKWWCLLWFDNLRSPVLSKVSEVYTVWPEYWDFGVKEGVYGPQIASCDIPPAYADQVPQAISIQTTDDCSRMEEQPGNVLRVIHQGRKVPKGDKPSIGICVQAFRFGTYDVSVRLVEWLEMVKLMGAEQVYFYVYGATASMVKVLQHYRQEGFVNWRRLTLPGEQVNVESLFNYYFNKLGGRFWPQELLELNDCLYRNLYRHDYVAIFDIDEMIMPQQLGNWHELIEKIRSGLSEKEKHEKAFYLNRHAYVYEMFEETQMAQGQVIPDYLYMMRHTNRAKLLGEGENIKCFHRTDLVTAVHNHFPMRCLNSTGHHSCSGLTIDPKESILMHYRRNRSPPENCPTPNDPKKCSIHDVTAWRYFDALSVNVKKQLFNIFG